MTVLFTAWGYQVTLLEAAAALLAFAAVGLGIVGTRWTWPLYLISSSLYLVLFLQWHLPASAAMQVIFLVAAVWGWFSWGKEGARVPGRLSPRARWLTTAATIVAWLALTPLLAVVGDAAPLTDSWMFVGSLAAQVLMVLLRVETWVTWVAVNVVGTVLYASQNLYFTALLYGVLAVMAVLGWREWAGRMAPREADTRAPVDVV